MKGIVLAGGTGSRLAPLTDVTNKHLLPVYNKPMVYYPLLSFKQAGVTDVMIVSGPGHTELFEDLLGDGSKFGMHFEYATQEKPGGIAQALALCSDFIGNDKFAVILGDNVIEDDLSGAFSDFEQQDGGAKIFLKEVETPESYGVAEVAGDKIVSLVEKPVEPKSNLAVIGCYMYEPRVFDVIAGLKPSDRGELEITDVNNHYLAEETLTYEVLKGFWGDCGESFGSLYEATTMVKDSDLASKNLVE